MTTPGCFAGSRGPVSAAGCDGATSTRTAAGAADTGVPRATRTRLPSCSISISVRPVSSRSVVSSWINSWSTNDADDVDELDDLDDFAITDPFWPRTPLSKDRFPHCVTARGRSPLLPGSDQRGEARYRQHVAIDAEAGDDRFRGLGDV